MLPPWTTTKQTKQTLKNIEQCVEMENEYVYDNKFIVNIKFMQIEFSNWATVRAWLCSIKYFVFYLCR